MAKTELGKFTSYLPFYRSVGEPNVNARDALRMGDDSGTPLQFRYEAADCRIYYTAQMTIDISSAWKAAADSMWGNKNHCVAGALKQGTIGQNAMIKQPRSARTMSTKVVTEPNMNMADYKVLMRGLDVFTDQIPKFTKAQGIMLP